MYGYFARFTETIKEDIERGTSIITCDNNGHDQEDQIVEGLCAFGPFEDIEDAHKKAKFMSRFFGKQYSIIKGNRGPIEGSMGQVCEEPVFVSSHIVE